MYTNFRNSSIKPIFAIFFDGKTLTMNFFLDTNLKKIVCDKNEAIARFSPKFVKIDIYQSSISFKFSS